MKSILKFFIYLIPCFLSITLSGQRYISGRITDAENGEPVIGVSVFIDNTTVGTASDTEGRYKLKIPENGSYRLMISHVGYKSEFKDIEPGGTSVVFDASLQINQLEEFTVSAKVRFRQTDINLFWNTILGKNPSRRTIQATNPEKVYYYYNPETKILKATCREPLEIINYETGYQIQYMLENFTHDYNTGFTDWKYQSVFTELEPQDLRQKNNWAKNRKAVYDVSVTKFIKSLYNNTLLHDGFVLADFNLNPDPATPYSLILLNSDDIVRTNPVTNSKTMNINRMVLLICYGMPVTKHELEKFQAKTSQLQTPEYYDTRKISSSLSSSQLELERRVVNRVSDLQQKQMGKGLDNYGKIMNMLLGDSIRIFPDGTFTNTLSMGRVNNSVSLMGIGMRLPTDYISETSTSSAIADDMAANTYNFDNIAQHFDRQLSVFPQEKIHLHTDRDYYVPGEKIHFKAYITDAATHRHQTKSRYVYAELINARDSLVGRVMIRPDNDMYYGCLFLSEIIPEGNYTLRAYTRYMENLGDDYFFKKNIRIGNINGGNNLPLPPLQRGIESGNSRNPANSENLAANPGSDYDVSFFPEGGNPVDGVWCKTAFKALNINGYPEIISGEIMDEKGSVITSIQTFHAGMGVFSFIPKQGKKYFLKCRNENGLEKQFELPQPDSHGYALTVSQHNKRIAVGVLKAVNTPERPCYLLAHCRGEVFYFSRLDNISKNIAFSEQDFPSGIIQFVLFDQQMNPLSERLVFSKNNDTAKVGFHTDKAVYARREKVITSLSITDSDGTLSDGHLSVAITDDKDIAVDETTTILSSLLLSSELKGYIENPAWYLQDNMQSSTALDYLMMTHGWRRYNIPEVVKGNIEQPSIAYQTSQEISGNVKRTGRSGANSNNDVLIQLQDGEFGITSADEKGRFLFKDFEYPDSTSYFLRSLNHKGNERMELVVDKESFPKLIHAPQSLFVRHKIIDLDTKDYSGIDAFITKAEQRSQYDEDMRVIYLSEVVVTAQRIERKKEEPRLQFWANSSSDATIRVDDQKRSAALTVTDLLRQNAGAGVNVKSEGIISIRGAFETTGYLPLVIIDGMPYEWLPGIPPLENVSVMDVESIDVFKNAGTTVFGIRGAGGVISITTRRGIGNNDESNNDEPNYTVFTPLGYQKPVAFYSPKYETLDAKRSSIPDYRTTIFWKPDVVISDDGKASFEFYTSDFPTTYSIVIEGLTSNGKIVRQVEKIQIK